jgi:glycolate oxidase FAD binding subunit
MSISSNVPLADLSTILGDRAYTARPSDSIAGIQPSIVVEPIDETEIASILSYANQHGLKVLIRGAGTQLNTGAPPQAGDIVLSTTRLDALLEYAPHDLTVSVQAGMPLSELQATLAQNNQWLALDPILDPAATIGALVATNVSGAHRLRFGGVRDQLIGVRVVLTDGTIAKGGGKVVKNVAGYDLPKLFTGSLGTLGVIVSATFRLYPLRPASNTILLHAPTLPPLCSLVEKILDSILEPTVIDLFSPQGDSPDFILAIRFESEPQSIHDQAQMLLDHFANSLSTSAITLADADEQQFWQQVSHIQDDCQDTSTIQIKASLLLTEVGPWLTQLQQITQQQSITIRWRAHAGHGIVHARLHGTPEALITAIATLRQQAMARQGSLVVTQVLPSLAQQLDIWGPVPSLAIMQQLKSRFDPQSTLNPGRFVGGI